MRIAYVVGGFPVISETFVGTQIAGMVARACEVDILAMSSGPTAGWPKAVDRYNLMARVQHLGAPRNYLSRLYRIARLLVVYGWRAPGPALRSLNVMRFGRSAATLGLLHAVLTLVRLGARKYDVIHAQFGPYGNLALRLVQTGALSAPVVTSFRGYDATEYLRANPRAYDQLFRIGSLFLPVSQALATRIVEAGCDPSRVRVHHSGIECARFVFQERSRTSNQMTKITMVGRLMEKKGIGFGIRAIARVVASGRSVSCTIIGDGPLRDELEQLIRELDLGAYVKMAGSRSHDDVLELLAQSHILIAPSVTAGNGDEEGIPNSIKEAMATGLPVVSTWHGGIPELIEDGVSGFLVPERDVAALADRLTHLVDRPETWATIGRAGRRRIEAEYDADRLNDDLLALYGGLVESPQDRRSEGGTCANGSAMSGSTDSTSRSAQGRARYH